MLVKTLKGQADGMLTALVIKESESQGLPFSRMSLLLDIWVQCWNDLAGSGFWVCVV